MISLLLLVLATTAPSVPAQRSADSEHAVRRCNSRSRGCEDPIALRIFDASSSGQFFAGRGCDAAQALGALSVLPYACVNGDASQVASSGYALTTVGAPTTQTMAWCGHAFRCPNVARQITDAGDYWTTAAVATPAGDFSVCWRGIADQPLTTGPLIVQTTNNAWNLRENSGGGIDALIGNVTVLTNVGVLGPGADQISCFTYHHVGAGNVNRLTAYVGGAQVGQSTTAPEVIASSNPIKIGSTPTRTRFALFTSQELGAGVIASLAAATGPLQTGTRGEPLAYSGNSIHPCPAPDGSITWLPPGRPCLSGGVRPRPAWTNLYLQSEGIASGSAFNSAWTATGTPTALADQARGPDGALTADLITFSATTDRVRQSFTASATAYAQAISVKSVAATDSLTLQIFDQTSVSTLGNAVCAVNSSTWTRCVAVSSVATAGHTIWPQLLIGSGSNKAFYLTDAQFETGTIASDPCPTTSASAACSAETPTLALPSWVNPNEGCAKVCVVPSWTGSNPLGTQNTILSANSAPSVRLMQFGSGTTVAAFDGVTSPTVAGALVAGSRSCFVTRWSKSGNSLSVTNLTTGVIGTAAATSGFPAFGATLNIGANYAGASQPNAATISEIQLGSSAGACQ